ncbi:choice-of-anchor D domain-containing protein [Psychroserpens sp.]|uniref:choice-of-anchor D domain-containing protein n=1 Tax=Psychroserpens sp. TaxID=2020870 RepID=UPI001B2EC3E3|nr:choice-of-anchor D domain-containing protein [Psychroserpens sp.]MBO6605538.1 choice-of-anchor D domain-containing protein [Psychroserpens sp.]MBO6630791.1 choice-of-anchor D domain-containing protein [Psychroserpens sp.]MBO6653653.1 choice-of-anchor D domain-containing protein [Psychroserpens sp.]MBO6681974.1 choice-of-anchor D domain-containing protein [Psychroserpens sp.]MBO6748912.1 choice-of-anchor D domain-containing protein [Psychroserpens sp.]
MKKNYALIFFAFLCFIFIGNSQTTIGIQDFETVPATPTMTYTGGSIATGTGPVPAGDNNFVSGTQAIEVSNGTAVVEFSSVNASAYTNVYFTCRLASFSGTSGNGADGADEVFVEVSTDGGSTWSQELEVRGNSNARWSFDTGTGLATTTYDGDNNATLFVPAGGGNRTTDGYSTIVVDGLPNSANLRVRLRMNNNSANEYWIADDAEILGTISCTDAVDFANIQFPTASPQTITVGDNFTVFSQGVEPGVTNASAVAPGAGIEVWIGYSSTDNDPSVSSGWTWVPATYNVDVGANDEFQAEIGSGLAVGTYYYASRWRLNGCNFVYGGTGGFWNNDSVELIVEADQVNFCNVDFPKTATITLGDNHFVYAQAYEPGVTDAVGQGPGLEAWIGYNTVDNNPSIDPGWTWVAATYDSDWINNDQYVAEIGSSLPAGTYYYASRFRLNGSEFSYGGIQADNVGNFWDPVTNNSGILIINNPPVADVVITEIMYNTPTPGTDQEWIEICNLNGTPEDISNYTIDVNGTTQYTFPAATTIPANSCITVILGNGTGAFDCPFTPTYNSGNATNVLPNSPSAAGVDIEIVAPFGVTADLANYDDADGADGNGSSLHVIDATLDNSDTSSNWQEVITGGSPNDNTLISPCTVPEIQLVDDSNTDQPCGSFTIDFGSQAIGFDTDITFDIDNDGSTDLNVTSFAFGGANAADFSIVSPATPFVVSAGNTQTVTVRFTPSATGTRNATLTINNDDADESACVVDLTGVGTTPAPEINVEGNIGAFPDIADGDTTPTGIDNTLFAAQFIGSSQEKTYRIQNIGTDVLNISNITVGGTNPGDFTITVAPASTVAVGGVTIFEVSFSPLAAGVRQADIIITNDDSDENPYNFRVQGTGNCVANAISITPQSGPVGTVVTVTGTNLSTATALFNGVNATVNNISNTEMEVIVPSGALTGNLEIVDDLGCPGSEPFTVIDTQIADCEGGTALSELFISEVTDATYGSLTYIEIYNATGAAINLSNYEIRVYSNGNTGSFNSQTLSGTINADDTFVLTIGTSGVLGNALCATPGGDGSYGDQVSATLAGVNVDTNEHDFIGLYNSSTLVDAFGVFGDDDWMDSLGTSITGDRGFNFRRLNTATPLPTATFDENDWNIIDWAGSGSTSCVATNDYSDIGTFDFSTGNPPTITVQPNLPLTNCDLTASISVTATEGFVGGNSLVYQWYFSAPGDTGWTAVTNGATYSGATAATLNILDALNLDEYQYYCEVRENTVTCSSASNAVQLNIARTVWDGTTWSNGTPDINTVAVIDGAYDTATDGNFSACQLIINATYTLTIGANSFVEVENNLTVNGNIFMNTSGSFVQNNDSGIVDGAVLSDKTRISVEKQTGFLNSFQEYTYWSSPVVGETIGDGLQEALDTRRFSFNAQNFLDATQETNNDNTATPGQDDIDDNGDDWTLVNDATVMQTGVGYASTHDPAIFFAPAQYIYVFQGAFNNGAITVPIYRNDAEMNDNNWNFIGNPYPSAVDADLFLAANASIDQTVGATNGAIFFWSHNTPADGNTNGNEALNYTQSDYAIINGTGQTAGGDGIFPDRFIPSGQGFFVSMTNAAASTTVSGTIETTDIVFNNSMRVTGNNAQFFRTSQINQYNKLRIDLTSDNGIFNQILIGYVDGATNEDDGMYYDAYKNLSANANALIYSLLDDSTELKYAIQGKAPSDLSIDEVIPLGFFSIIDEPTLYTISIASVEGDFMTSNTVYLRDNLLGVVHDLSNSDYVFTSDPMEDNTRFEILFQPETLSLTENEISPNELIITELTDGNVKFSIGNNLIIESVEIIDLLGRVVYNLNGNSSEEIFDLSKLSQAPYIAKVSLSNGQIITKKAIKRK